MIPLNTLLSLLGQDSNNQGFALIRRQGSATVDVLRGPVVEAKLLADIPLNGPEVLAMVPFRQVQERGFKALEDSFPILCLLAEALEQVPLPDLLTQLPTGIPDLEDLGFSMPDERYAEVVRQVIDEEIGRGEGANFVIRRDYQAQLHGDRVEAALAWFRRLLEQESGAYWTFAFVTDGMIAVGASPERHVSTTGGTVRMNPISGTLRHAHRQPDTETLLTFLADRKESEELVMVVDEELKMMSAACPEGGVMRGPYLKPMSQLTHTEYLLEGQSSLDPREILRLTMFAPTVTGSPMGNACTVIARHEESPRGYYSGVLARFTQSPDGYQVDAPILIRTAFLDADGKVTVSAGATLVRHSDPLSEAAETRAKASGMLTALGLLPARKTVVGPQTQNPAVEDPKVLAALQERNRHLAAFWRDEQVEQPLLAGRTLVIDCGDDFTAMLAHQLRRLGLDAHVESWDRIQDVDEPDLVVFGPGPGDPESATDPRITRLRELISQRLSTRKPLVAVCLSHQVLSSLAGLPIEKLPEPRQGTPLLVTIGAEQALIGYYNTFSAVATDGTDTPKYGLTVHSEPETGYVHALTGPGVASVQGHLESVLSYDGFSTLARLVGDTLVNS